VYKFACFESFTRLSDDGPSEVRKHSYVTINRELWWTNYIINTRGIKKVKMHHV